MYENKLRVWRICRDALQNWLSRYKHAVHRAIDKGEQNPGYPVTNERRPIHSRCPDILPSIPHANIPACATSRSLFMCNVISAIAAVRARVSFVFYVRVAFLQPPHNAEARKLLPTIAIIANKARYFAINTDTGRKMLVFFYTGFVSGNEAFSTFIGNIVIKPRLSRFDSNVLS